MSYTNLTNSRKQVCLFIKLFHILQNSKLFLAEICFQETLYFVVPCTAGNKTIHLKRKKKRKSFVDTRSRDISRVLCIKLSRGRRTDMDMNLYLNKYNAGCEEPSEVQFIFHSFSNEVSFLHFISPLILRLNLHWVSTVSSRGE